MPKPKADSVEFRRTIPEECGVYLFYSASRQLLYVGKAIDLRRRITQHFSAAGGAASMRIRAMHGAVDAVSWVIAPTELHALMLEDALIKRLSPIYNKQQNKYRLHVWLELCGRDDSELRLLKSPPAEPSRRDVHGPYRDRHFAGHIGEIARNYYGAKSSLRYSGRGRFGSRGVSGNTYLYVDRFATRGERVDALRRFLEGDDPELLAVLEREMAAFTDRQEFESAARARDTLRFCRSFLDRRRFFSHFRDGAVEIAISGAPGFRFERGNLVSFGGEPGGEWTSWLAFEDGEVNAQSQLLDRAAVVDRWVRMDPARALAFSPV